jgi:predicted O-methyltransferase YrrM
MNDTSECSGKTLDRLCNLVESLSIHQRQLGMKIEELHRHHEQLFFQQNTIYSQIDALFSIFSVLQVRYPLPTMRGWPVSPDFVKILVSMILDVKPSVILELGSGVSTVVSAYSLEKNGRGRLVSIDHDPEYAEKTNHLLDCHGLTSWAEVICRPLKEQFVSGEKRLWYSLDVKDIPESLDMVVVDGPPAKYGHDIRYPALPFVSDRLSDCAVIIMDDAGREGEMAVSERWMTEYPSFVPETVDTEKGTLILRKKGNRS